MIVHAKDLPGHSVGVALMERVVCPHCQHLHRQALAYLCDCCKADVRAHFDHPPQPARYAQRTRCKICGGVVQRVHDRVYAHLEEMEDDNAVLDGE